MKPKAEWIKYESGSWCAEIGPYSVNAEPVRGAWWVDSSEGELASNETEGPCDVVTLMLAAEEALRAHLAGVAESMRWPTEETEDETEEEPKSAEGWSWFAGNIKIEGTFAAPDVAQQIGEEMDRAYERMVASAFAGVPQPEAGYPCRSAAIQHLTDNGMSRGEAKALTFGMDSMGGLGAVARHTVPWFVCQGFGNISLGRGYNVCPECEGRGRV